jgi:hypothetical protein
MHHLLIVLDTIFQMLGTKEKLAWPAKMRRAAGQPPTQAVKGEDTSQILYAA